MAPLRQLFLLATLALTGVSHSLSVSASAAGSSSSSGPGQAQCKAVSLKAADAPVRAPLVAVIGEKLVDTVINFITDTPFGKVLAGEDAQTCIANLNGTMIGTTLMDRLKTPTCAAFYNLTDVPFLKVGLDALTANETAMPSFSDLLKVLKAVPNSDVDRFCELYTTGIVPCIATELLPALAVLRAKYASNCCDAWNDHVLADYGYTISGQLTKMAQLFGDVMCAKQTPGMAGAESQRCGYTAFQTLITKNDTASFAATVLRNLQVPTDQMCLRAEGNAYTDTNANSVAAVGEPTPSGCVITLDRITSWVYGLPSTQIAKAFDVKMLLEDNKCLPGSELYPTFKFLLPQLASSEVEVYFNKSCVHLPMQFGDKCAYTRPALLVEWPNEPLPVASRESRGDGGTATKATAATRTPSQTTAAPLASSSSSSRCRRVGGCSSVVAGALTVLLTLTIAR